MVSLQDALLVLFPNASQPNDYLVEDRNLGDGPYIKEWNLQIPKPTPEQLAAITQEQVNEAKLNEIKNKAIQAALLSNNPEDVANRTDAKLQWTAINDHAEVLGYILYLLNIDKDKFITDITNRRNGIKFEQSPTDPGIMFDELTRQSQSMILRTLGQAIATGVGDPIK